MTGKTALITGAAGTLGQEHSIALLECGANIVITDVDQRKLLGLQSQLQAEFSSTSISVAEMDVTEYNSILAVQQRLREDGINVNVLVNNAAIDAKVRRDKSFENSSRFEEFRVEQWEREVAVGLTGSMLCSQVFGLGMVESKLGGVILNIASDLSVIAPNQKLYQKDGLAANMQPVKPVTYSVIKTGIIGLTRYLSTYWAASGVRCNALSPGGVIDGQDPAFITKLEDLIPVGRMAKKTDYRAAIQFLCSDASAYMNGHNLIMDGGRSVI